MANKSTLRYLDAIKQRHDVKSDYAVSKLLGITRQQVSNYHRRGEFFSDITALRVAELLDIEFMEVLAAQNAERARRPDERKVWVDLAKKAAGAVAGLAAVHFALSLLGLDFEQVQGVAALMLVAVTGPDDALCE